MVCAATDGTLMPRTTVKRLLALFEGRKLLFEISRIVENERATRYIRKRVKRTAQVANFIEFKSIDAGTKLILVYDCTMRIGECKSFNCTRKIHFEKFHHLNSNSWRRIFKPESPFTFRPRCYKFSRFIQRRRSQN